MTSMLEVLFPKCKQQFKTQSRGHTKLKTVKIFQHGKQSVVFFKDLNVISSHLTHELNWATRDNKETSLDMNQSNAS